MKGKIEGLHMGLVDQATHWFWGFPDLGFSSAKT